MGVKLDTVRFSQIDTPIGPLLSACDDGGGLCGLWFERAPDAGWRRDDAAFDALRAQLDSYFAGELRAFDLPMATRGTPWQQTVWDALVRIPYGSTVTYGALAARLGRPAAARAVGAANGRNPISVVVPCHRLVGSTGGLTGYAGGLSRKEWLLRHERAIA